MPKLIVLMFHGVVSRIPEYAIWRGGRTCLLRVSDFERVVRWCAERHRFIRLSEVEGFLSSGVDETSVLLTFDDGLASVTNWAAPVLKAHGAAAAVFVTNDWTRGGRTPTVFLLERDLLARMPTTIRIESGNEELTGSVAAKRDVQALMGRIWSLLLSSETAPLALDPLQVTFEGKRWSPESVPESREFWFPASVDELRRGVEGGVFEIGSHGVSHIPWTMLSTSELRRELQQSKHELEQEFQAPVESCSYPNGLVNSEAVKLVGEVFRLAFTSRRAIAEAGTPRLELPRIHVPSEPPVWVGGVIRYPNTALALRRAARLLGVR